MPVDVTDIYIHIRVREPDLFMEGSFRTIDVSVEKGIKAIIGKLKKNPSGAMVIQSYLFLREKWTKEEAIRWVEEHKKHSTESIVKLYQPIFLSEQKTQEKSVKFYRGKTLAIDEDEKTAWVIATTESIDRDGEVILLDAWKKRFHTFLKHPVLVSSHNYKSLIAHIGEVIEHRFTENGLEMKLLYYAGKGNAEADWGWELVRRGMAMYSVSFLKYEYLEGNKIPPKYQGAKRVYVDVELLELSQVVVGANSGALQLSYDLSDEECQYTYEVLKAFKGNIPKFETKSTDEIQKKDNTEEDEKNKDEDNFISPVFFKDLKDLDMVLNIWKSGNLITRKNQIVLRQAKEYLMRALEIVEQLLNLTQKPEEEEKEEDKKRDSDIEKLIQEIKILQEKIKS